MDLPSYISGYVDGEGCFTVSISPRPTLRVGWEVRPSLSVSQNGDRSEVLLAIQRYFGCGTLRPDRSDQTLKWEVRSLPSSSSGSSLTFGAIRCSPASGATSSCSQTSANAWLEGSTAKPMDCREIVRWAGEMNPSGKRGYSPETILQDLLSR